METQDEETQESCEGCGESDCGGMAAGYDPGAPEVIDAVAAAALIADPTRAGVLALLRSGPRCVGDMTAALNERQNNLSMHLARLREAGLIRRAHLDPDARRVHYERDEEACASTLARLEALLGRPQ